jgi:hypothetical protein
MGFLGGISDTENGLNGLTTLSKFPFDSLHPNERNKPKD